MKEEFLNMIETIVEANPTLTGFFAEDENEAFRGIDDSINMFFVQPSKESEFDKIDDCGRYEVSMNVTFIFSLKCKDVWSVSEKVFKNVGALDNIEVLTMDINGRRIYEELYEQDLHSEIKIIKIETTYTTIRGTDCLSEICCSDCQ